MATLTKAKKIYNGHLKTKDMTQTMPRILAALPRVNGRLKGVYDYTFEDGSILRVDNNAKTLKVL